MIIGPFRIFEVDTIKAMLDMRKVRYEIFIDEDRPKPSEDNVDVAFIFFDIAPDDFIKVKGPLENYGVVAASDGSFELGEEE